MSIKAVNKSIESMIRKYPDASLVENRYKVISAVILECYPILKEISKATREEITHDIIHLDRKFRRLTEGQQDELKKILSQEKQIELGYEPGFNRKIVV